MNGHVRCVKCRRLNIMQSRVLCGEIKCYIEQIIIDKSCRVNWVVFRRKNTFRLWGGHGARLTARHSSRDRTSGGWGLGNIGMLLQISFNQLIQSTGSWADRAISRIGWSPKGSRGWVGIGEGRGKACIWGFQKWGGGSNERVTRVGR